jgi:hypothetical protein
LQNNRELKKLKGNDWKLKKSKLQQKLKSREKKKKKLKRK